MRKILDEKLDSKVLNKMKFPERLARQRQVLEDLIAKYPRELEPYNRLHSLLFQYAPDDAPVFRDRLLRMAKGNPDDPLALLLAGRELWGKDTPEAIRLLEAAKAQALNFPWPALSLAGIYFSGKRADPDKAKENLETFFSICPASRDGYAQFLLPEDQSLRPKVDATVAMALRARLEKETDPKRLMDFRVLWGREFRTRPPQEHDALRAQVARDVKRLETLNPQGDAEWQALLIDGYKQGNASKEAITAMEDRLLRECPHSSEAFTIVSDRWEAAHKEPEDQSDAAAWARYQKEYEEAVKAWVRDYPDITYLQRQWWFDAIEDDDSISEKDGIAALDAFLQYVNDFDGPFWFPLYYPKAARFLIERGWEPTRALGLLKEQRALQVKEFARARDSDDLSDENLKSNREWQTRENQEFYGLMLRALKQAARPEEALELKASIETPPPQDKKFQSGYWLNRGRLEALENHAQDALAYYQLALQTRSAPPKAYHGKLRDDLTDEARALWTAQGGTEAAWAVWSKPASGGTEQIAEGAWEKPTKAIPVFELSDLSGKTWRLKELAGKAVLINVWATWCGPCQAELPHLQKFYEKVKSRSDLQVLTFNIDVDLGLVARYLKEKGYTFPVLPVYSAGVLDDFSVPQNWVVDPHGIWRWKQPGYSPGTYADFEKEMLERLESAKTSP